MEKSGDQIEKLKLLLREVDSPFFSDVELTAYLRYNDNDLNKTVYQCALLKAQNSGLSVGGLTLENDAAYFRRLASHYRPNNSGVLKGGF